MGALCCCAGGPDAANVAVATAGPTVVSGSFYIPAGEDLYFAPNSNFRANASVTYYDLMEAGSGSGTTVVNIGAGAGGGGGADLPLFQFAEGAVSVGVAVTNTYTIPYTGTYRILLTGAGGTGWVSDTGGSLNVGAGGGAGFAMIHAMALEAGDTIEYTLGTRVENSGRDSAGSAGGDSSVSINGTEVMTAAGGGGGNIGVGGTGGDATGGDFRLSGSVGGTGNPASTGGNGGLANLTPPGADSSPFAIYLGNITQGNTGNGGRGTTNGTSTGASAYIGIQGSGMTN